MSDPELSVTDQVRRILGQIWVRRALSCLAGLLAALMLHYALFRVELPSKPFIYVSF